MYPIMSTPDANTLNGLKIQVTPVIELGLYAEFTMFSKEMTVKAGLEFSFPMTLLFDNTCKDGDGMAIRASVELATSVFLRFSGISFTFNLVVTEITIGIDSWESAYNVAELSYPIMDDESLILDGTYRVCFIGLGSPDAMQADDFVLLYKTANNGVKTFNLDSTTVKISKETETKFAADVEDPASVVDYWWKDGTEADLRVLPKKYVVSEELSGMTVPTLVASSYGEMASSSTLLAAAPMVSFEIKGDASSVYVMDKANAKTVEEMIVPTDRTLWFSASEVSSKMIYRKCSEHKMHALTNIHSPRTKNSRLLARSALMAHVVDLRTFCIRGQTTIPVLRQLSGVTCSKVMISIPVLLTIWRRHGLATSNNIHLMVVNSG